MRISIIYESIVLLTTQILALVVGMQMIGHGIREEVLISETSSGISFFLFAMAFATVFMILLIKLLKKEVFFQLLFGMLLFIGMDIVFAFLVGEPLAILIALALTITRFKKPVVWLQNIMLVTALAGVSAQLAMFFNVTTIIAVLIIASLYDYIAVFRTKHMVKMFTSLLERGAAFAVIIPEKGSIHEKIGKGLIHKRGAERKFILIGTGDIAFPSIFAVSVFAEFSPIHAAVVMVGSLIGLLFDSYWVKKFDKPMPALPAISFFAIVSFMLVRYVFVF